MGKIFFLYCSMLQEKVNREAYCELFENFQDGIFFSGNVPAMKNSKQIFCRGRGGGKATVLPSKICIEYATQLSTQLYEKWEDWITLLGDDPIYPLFITYTFVRNSRRAFDHSNLVEVLQDCMSCQMYQKKTKIKGTDQVKTTWKYVPKELQGLSNLSDRLTWIPDDNMKYVVPLFNPDVYVDTQNPGVYINILK